MTKPKAKIQPAAQPTPAAPAVVAPATETSDANNPAPETPAAPAVGMAPNGNAIVEEKPHPLADKIAKCRDGLKSFPTLAEGYVCARGVYYVREIAEDSLETDEELIIVTLEKK